MLMLFCALYLLVVNHFIYSYLVLKCGSASDLGTVVSVVKALLPDKAGSTMQADYRVSMAL